MTIKNKKQNLHEFEETEDSYSPNQNFKIKMSEPHSPTMKEGFSENTDDDMPEGTVRVLNEKGLPVLHIKPHSVEKSVQSNFVHVEDLQNRVLIQIQDRAISSEQLLKSALKTRRQILSDNNKALDKISKLKKSFYCG